MITNRSPYWVTVMADLEQEDPLFIRNHISAEFLEATCEVSFGYCDVCKRVDPFCPHQTARSVPASGAATSLTGTQPWGTPIASTDACPTCGQRPWWADIDRDASEEDDFEEDTCPQTGFVRGYKRYG